ncbi:maleylpyruvate isomerase family mycothiol-dependent enzyme [soil metagenome]
MTTLTDRAISALRNRHDTLAELVAAATDEQLAAISGAVDWSVADVLSHLGSGAEIMRFPILAAIDGTPAPDGGRQPIWDRWNALSPREQATQFVDHDERYVATVEALDDGQRAELVVDLGFLPQPVPLEVALGMRLDEVALHAWDVLVAQDATASLDDESAGILLELMGGSMGFLLGFLGKADQLEHEVVLQVGDRALSIGDTLSLGAGPGSPTATWVGPDEAVVRLVVGRLGAAHTPAGVQVKGNVTIDELRRVFPGF